eukprot:2152616-Pyramimonas_sp.AAC.1
MSRIRNHMTSTSSSAAFFLGDFNDLESGEARLQVHDGVERASYSRLASAFNERFPMMGGIVQSSFTFRA